MFAPRSTPPEVSPRPPVLASADPPADSVPCQRCSKNALCPNGLPQRKAKTKIALKVCLALLVSTWSTRTRTDSMLPSSTLTLGRAIDQWFEDLQHYQTTLEDMTAASLDQVGIEWLFWCSLCNLTFTLFLFHRTSRKSFLPSSNGSRSSQSRSELPLFTVSSKAALLCRFDSSSLCSSKCVVISLAPRPP